MDHARVLEKGEVLERGAVGSLDESARTKIRQKVVCSQVARALEVLGGRVVLGGGSGEGKDLVYCSQWGKQDGLL